MMVYRNIENLYWSARAASYLSFIKQWDDMQYRLEAGIYSLLGGGELHWIGENIMKFYLDPWYKGCGQTPERRIQKLWHFYFTELIFLRGQKSK